MKIIKMSFIDLLLILPELFLLNAAVILIWVGLYLRRATNNSGNLGYLNFYGIFIQLITILLIWNTPCASAVILSSSFIIATSSLFFRILILLFSISVFVVCYQSEKIQLYNLWYVEIVSIRILIVVMLLLLVCINNLIYMFFIFEVISLSTYILVAHRTRNTVYLSEVALKYFLVGTFFSVVMSYSIALFYWVTGLTNLAHLALHLCVNLNATTAVSWNLINIAAMLLLISLLFKLVAAPFHQWAPDVYDGTSISNMAFLFIIPKIAILTLILKLEFLWNFPIASTLLVISTLLSIVIGATFGLFQKRIKRLLTYSMINNNAFFLLSMLSVSVYSHVFLFFFLVTYLLTLTGLFALLQTLRTKVFSSSLINIWGWSNLFFTDKVRAFCLSLLLFSSAGIPPLVGFLSKFLLLFSVVSNNVNLNYLVVILLTFSILTCFYYVRFIKTMAFNKRSATLFLKTPNMLSSYLISLSIAALLILFTASGLLINTIFILFL